MSFAAKSKSLNSTARFPAVEKTGKSGNTRKTLDRIALLEKTTAKLKKQQETLQAVVDLVQRVDDFTSADSELNSLQHRLSLLESTADAQCVSDSLPLSLPQCDLEDDFRDLRRSVTGIEVMHQSLTLKHRLELKGTEIYLKETILDLLVSCERGVSQAKTEFETVVSELVGEVGKQAEEAREHVEAVSGRRAAESEELEAYLAQGILTHTGVDKSSFLNELSPLILSAVADLRSIYDFRLSQFGLIYQQELSVLLNLLHMVKVHSMPISFSPGATPAQICEVYTETESCIEQLEASSKSSIASLTSVIPAVQSTIESLKVRLSDYSPCTSSPESTADLEEMLNSCLFQLEFFTRSIDLTEQQTELEFQRMARGVAVLEAERTKICENPDYDDLIWLENLSPRLERAQTAMEAEMETAKTQLKTVATELNQMWTAAYAEKSLDISVPESPVWDSDFPASHSSSSDD